MKQVTVKVNQKAEVEFTQVEDGITTMIILSPEQFTQVIDGAHRVIMKAMRIRETILSEPDIIVG